MTKKDNLVGLVSRFGRTLSMAGDRIAKETRIIAKLSRLRIKLKDMDYEFEETMKKIGELHYQSGGQAPSEAYFELVRKADEIKVQMEKLQVDIDQVMAAQRGEMQVAEDYDDAYFLGEDSPFVDGDEEEAWEKIQTDEPEAGLEEFAKTDPLPEDASPCPSCGQLMSHGLAYCTNCRAKL